MSGEAAPQAPGARPTLLSYSAIPAPALALINQVIQTDEGGWILSGGALAPSFGGIDENTWDRYFPTGPTLAGALSEFGAEILSELCCRIYFQDYYLPLQAKDPAGGAPPPAAWHFSALINIGQGDFDKLGPLTPKMVFLTAWKEFYFDIFRASPGLYGVDIHGWINRVWRYL